MIKDEIRLTKYEMVEIRSIKILMRLFIFFQFLRDEIINDLVRKMRWLICEIGYDEMINHL